MSRHYHNLTANDPQLPLYTEPFWPHKVAERDSRFRRKFRPLYSSDQKRCPCLPSSWLLANTCREPQLLNKFIC